MKTIEERAKAYANEHYPEMTLYGDWADDGWDEGYNAAGRGVAEEAFIAGAEAEHAKLTRWNDPDELRPDNMQRVLVKYKKTDGSTKVGIATFHNPFGIGRGSFVMEASRPRYIIGWRQIYE